MADKPLVLVDGSSYLYRAYHALPPLTNSKGMPTGAVYGVLNMLKNLLKAYPTDRVAVIFDAKGGSFRNELYPAYKANRSAMPEELQVQIEPLHQAIRAMGFPLLVVSGVEADDVIGTLAHQAQQQGLATVISTGDKDMAQLVNEHVTLVNTMTDKTMDIAGVAEKFGVGPELMIDYLALVGDSVDNIPGVPKVGPKTAVKWLNEYGDLEGVVASADQIKGKVGENLRAHLPELPLAKILVTIKLDVPLELEPQQLMMSDPDNDALIALCQELEFKRWLAELQSAQGEPAMATHYETILTNEQWQQWLQRLQAAPAFSFDTETTSIDAMSADLVGISFAIKPGEAAYVPLMHDYEGAPKQLDKQQVLNDLRPLLQDPNKIIIGQNLKYDIKVLKQCGIEITAPMQDTLLESYVLNSTSTRHNLDALALKYLGHNTIHFEDVAGKGAKQLTFNQVTLDKAAPYAAEDADITLRLHQTLMPLIEEHAYSKKVLAQIEWPLMPILAKMEYSGVFIDAEILALQSKDLGQRIAELEKEVHSLAGEEFNLNSTKQLQQILFEKLQIPIIKKTPKGQPSTAEPVMQELALDYPIPKLILEYRSLAKLKSTYTDALPQQINSRTGRVHTHYNQAVTATGRLSSTSPNLQNIPVRTTEGRKIRQAFIAKPGYKILAADYSQVELRIMAHLSQDPGLLKAFANGWDVHASTAAEVFGVALEEVTTEQRRSAKAINFGLMYGMSSFGLSKQLGVSRKEAEAHMDVYFSRYPSVHGYMEKSRAQAAEHGYVETLFGRRLFVPDINASNMMRRAAAERAAINAPLQGSAAEIIKLAMICVDQWLESSELAVTMVMQVHDELVFEIADEALIEATKHIRHCMESAADLSVPLVVDVGVGDNWEAAH